MGKQKRHFLVPGPPPRFTKSVSFPPCHPFSLARFGATEVRADLRTHMFFIDWFQLLKVTKPANYKSKLSLDMCYDIPHLLWYHTNFIWSLMSWEDFIVPSLHSSNEKPWHQSPKGAKPGHVKHGWSKHGSSIIPSKHSIYHRIYIVHV